MYKGISNKFLRVKTPMGLQPLEVRFLFRKKVIKLAQIGIYYSWGYMYTGISVIFLGVKTPMGIQPLEVRFLFRKKVTKIELACWRIKK